MSGAVHDGLSPTGLRHLSLVEAMGCPFGLERSAKWSDGHINEDRFLASFHRDELGSRPHAELSRMAAAMGLRDGLPERFGACLSRADIVHVGHEGGQVPVAKIYLEFAGPARAAVETGLSGTVLVHLAAKWRIDGKSPASLTSYRLSPGVKAEALLCDRWRPWADGPPAELALAILRLARASDTGEPFFMDVAEEGSPRGSFDVNIYHADLTVARAAAPLRRLAQTIGIAEAAVADFLRRRGEEALGHISGGRGGDGRHFATLYYGVRARRGPGEDGSAMADERWRMSDDG